MRSLLFGLLLLLATPALADKPLTLKLTDVERARLPHGTTTLVFSAEEKAEYEAALAEAARYAAANCVQIADSASRDRQIIADINRAGRKVDAQLSDDQEAAVLAAVTPQEKVVKYCQASVAKIERWRLCLVKSRVKNQDRRPIGECVQSGTRSAVRASALRYCEQNPRAKPVIRDVCGMGAMDLAISK